MSKIIPQKFPEKDHVILLAQSQPDTLDFQGTVGFSVGVDALPLQPPRHFSAVIAATETF